MISIKDYFNSKSWSYTQPPNRNIFFLAFAGKAGTYQTILEIFKGGESLTFFSTYAQSVDESKINDILILLNYINTDSFLGNFELNNENAEIRYKTSLSLKHIKLDEQILDEIIGTNVTTMDTFSIAIRNVLFDNMHPLTAYQATQNLQP